jgi:hypothetical protein
MHLILFLLIMCSANARDWSKTESELKYIPGDLQFSNRSSCAKKSMTPTKSVFLIVDNVNIAKSVYRLAKMKQLDVVGTTNLGIEKFRYSLVSLIQLISAKILSGELPLIEDHKISDEYLAQNWEKSRKVNFKDFSSCRVIKKFSSLHSNLNVSKPDRVLLEQIAKDLDHSEDFFSACDDFSDLSEPQVALYQFDLKTKEGFHKIGFRFWYSLKVYLSWAFRYSPEMSALSEPFDYLFKSANLEEMVLFFSNGCESISAPACKDKDLSLENLRQFTHEANQIDWTNSDYIKPVPESAPNDFFTQPMPLKSDDLLNLGDYNSADEWAKNFRDNFIKARGYNKIKISKAISHLNLISSSIGPDLLFDKLKLNSLQLSEQGKQDLYYLCSEFQMAADKELSFLRQDLWKLKKVKVFDDILKDFTDKNLSDFFDFFERVVLNTNSFCSDLKQQRVWDDNFELKKEGFAPWYQQLFYQKKYALKDDLTLSSEITSTPYLSLSNGHVICQNAIHCSRLILDSMMSLSALSRSFSSIVPQDEILSSNMANPFAQRMACGAYDPWAKKNKIIFDFFHDMIQSATFGLLSSPVYVAATLDPKRIVSFETLVKEGEVFYDPKYDKRSLKLSLMADLGGLAGIPCAISVSGSKFNPFQYYMFNGISFSGCKERSKNDIVVHSADSQSQQNSYRSYCTSCAINLQTVASVASNINPIFRSSFFLIKGIVGLVSQIRDPDDLSRDWKVSPLQVALSYRYDGQITKSCTKKLIKGKSCLKWKCERDMMEKFISQYQVTPTYSSFSCFRGNGLVEVVGCDAPIYLSQNNNLQVDTTCQLKERK